MEVLFEQNYQHLVRLIPTLNSVQHCLLQAKDRPDVLFILKESGEGPIVSLGRYAFEGKHLLPWPEMSMMLLPRKKQVRMMGNLTRRGQLWEVYPVKAGKVQVDEVNLIALNARLNNWLDEMISLHYQPASLQWEHLPQEKAGQGYRFNGHVLFTQGLTEQLSAAEIALILIDLKRFVAGNNHSVDYLQVYTKGAQKVFCIDQLNKAMLEGDGYTPEEKGAFNYFTVMLAEEY